MTTARAGRCPFPSGTHLRVELPLYDHHAVVVPSGNVVEYADRVIQVTPYPHLTAGVRPQVVQSARVLPPDKVVHRAMFLVGERRHNVLTKLGNLARPERDVAPRLRPPTARQHQPSPLGSRACV